IAKGSHNFWRDPEALRWTLEMAETDADRSELARSLAIWGRYQEAMDIKNRIGSEDVRRDLERYIETAARLNEEAEQEIRSARSTGRFEALLHILIGCVIGGAALLFLFLIRPFRRLWKKGIFHFRPRDRKGLLILFGTTLLGLGALTLVS